jgi:hypothetical protein
MKGDIFFTLYQDDHAACSLVVQCPVEHERRSLVMQCLFGWARSSFIGGEASVWLSTQLVHWWCDVCLVEHAARSLVVRCLSGWVRSSYCWQTSSFPNVTHSTSTIYLSAKCRYTYKQEASFCSWRCFSIYWNVSICLNEKYFHMHFKRKRNMFVNFIGSENLPLSTEFDYLYTGVGQNNGNTKNTEHISLLVWRWANFCLQYKLSSSKNGTRTRSQQSLEEFVRSASTK